jgi:phosphoribosylformylglycinamidine synthase
MDIDLSPIPAQKRLSNTRLLYSESAGRFIVTIDPKKKGLFERCIAGFDYACIGRVSDTDILTVSGIEGKVIIREKLGNLKDAWIKLFGDLI